MFEVDVYESIRKFCCCVSIHHNLKLPEDLYEPLLSDSVIELHLISSQPCIREKPQNPVEDLTTIEIKKEVVDLDMKSIRSISYYSQINNTDSSSSSDSSSSDDSDTMYDCQYSYDN